MALSPGTRLGSYQVIAPLGKGGMGEVYRATDTKLGRDVAIKILPSTFTNDPERIARFHREAQVLAALNHPHIGAIYGLEEGLGQHYLVLELISGETLSDRLAAGPLPIISALAVAKQIAEALQAAHEKGIIHRDLKPSNIALTPNDEVKLLDFGLAKAEGESTIDCAETSNADAATTATIASGGGLIVGTVDYMSPEQTLGLALDSSSDIYALGVVTYQMITGRLPYDLRGKTSAEKFNIIRSEQPTELRNIPWDWRSDLESVLFRALQKQKTSRYRSVREMSNDINRIIGGLPIAAKPAPAWKNFLKWCVCEERIRQIGLVDLALCVFEGGFHIVWILLAIVDMRGIIGAEPPHIEFALQNAAWLTIILLTAWLSWGLMQYPVRSVEATFVVTLILFAFDLLVLTNYLPYDGAGTLTDPTLRMAVFSVWASSALMAAVLNAFGLIALHRMRHGTAGYRWSKESSEM